MDKKKLIGTIIGVTLFAALIAGATFAWLTFSITATNNVYNAATMEFMIDYSSGNQEITAVPALTAATSDTATVNTIKAYRTQNSAEGTLELKLTVDGSKTTLDLSTGVFNYAVCSATNGVSNCPTTMNLSEATVNSTTVMAKGTITTGENILYTTNTIAVNSSNATITNLKNNYYIYLWLDASKVTNTMLEEGHNKFNGYIHASATQR